MKNVSKTNKTNKTDSKAIRFNEVEVKNGSFLFSFETEDKSVSYECVFKKDLKGIASEKWTIDGKVEKVGIKKGCELAKFNEDKMNTIQMKRKATLKAIRGDDSEEKRLDFELKELASKIESYEDKIKKLNKKLVEKKNELANIKKFKEENEIDVEQLKQRSKEEQVARLKKQLEQLED